MLSQLHGLTPVLAIPIWDNYVASLEHALDFLARTFHSAGLAVIVFTIMIKTLLLPLTVKSTRSSKAMQELQPKVKELQKKYGKDRQKISQETMRLYSEYRVNPAAGCLPMIVQIPIFFGLYRSIRHLSQGTTSIHVSDYWTHGFLWLQSLAEPDPYKILPIAAGVFQFVQTKMMRPAGQEKVTDPQQAMMNTMMTFMPLMVVVFGWNFASGSCSLLGDAEHLLRGSAVVHHRLGQHEGLGSRVCRSCRSIAGLDTGRRARSTMWWW